MTVHREQSVKRETTNNMQQSDVYYQLLSQHVSGVIMPIFRRAKTVCYCIRCTALVLPSVVGSGCGALRYKMRAHLIVVSCWFFFFSLHTLLTMHGHRNLNFNGELHAYLARECNNINVMCQHSDRISKLNTPLCTHDTAMLRYLQFSCLSGVPV